MAYRKSTDRDLVESIESLLDKAKKDSDRPLKNARVRKAINSAISTAYGDNTIAGEGNLNSGGGGTGLSPPLTEKENSRVEKTRTLVSSDGLVEIDIADVTNIVMVDDTGFEIEFIFNPPSD